MALKPRAGDAGLAIGEGIQKMTVELLDAQLVEAPHQRQETGLVRRDVQVGSPEQERLVALVRVAVDQVGRLGVGARDDDARHPHDVELEAGGVEALDLFVRRNQNLAALVTALLGARTLVFDVVARHPHLDEAADQVAHVRVTAVTGVRVGDDERAVVVRGCAGALLLAHVQALVLLVAVRGEERAHQDGGVFGNLAQRVARQVGPRVFGGGPLGGSRPAAKVDALDTHPLHGHRLAG